MAIRYKGVIALAICVVLAAALLSLGWVNPAKEPVAQGDSLVKLQQWDEAIAAYGVAITIDPNYVVAYNNRGYAYRSLGDISKSDADFQMAAWYHP